MGTKRRNGIPRNSKEDVKEKLVNQILEARSNSYNGESDEEAGKDAANILKTQQQNMISIAYKQERTIKRFERAKKKNSYMSKELGTSDSAMCIKINL